MLFSYYMVTTHFQYIKGLFTENFPTNYKFYTKYKVFGFVLFLYSLTFPNINFTNFALIDIIINFVASLTPMGLDVSNPK